MNDSTVSYYIVPPLECYRENILPKNSSPPARKQTRWRRWLGGNLKS